MSEQTVYEYEASYTSAKPAKPISNMQVDYMTVPH